jgi:rare lipoprotein A
LFKFGKFLILLSLLVTSPTYGGTLYKIYEKNYNKYYSLEKYNVEGKAKVYSKHYHNKKTASGMKFSHNDHTAASVKLPLMSIVKVTNKRNRKSVHVLINDRGPYKTNAIIDLSNATASYLDYNASDEILIEFDIDKTIALGQSSLLQPNKY